MITFYLKQQLNELERIHYEIKFPVLNKCQLSARKRFQI